VRNRSARRPSLIRSIRTRLAVIFFLVTALSVAVIYVVVAPPLTSGLQHQKINDLQDLVNKTDKRPGIKQAYRTLRAIPQNQVTGKGTQAAQKNAAEKIQRIAEAAATTLANATVSQVTVINVLASPTGAFGPLPTPLAASPDPRDNSAIDDFAIGVPPDTLPPHGTQTGIVSTPRGTLGVVAVGISPKGPNTVSRVVIFSVPMNDVGGAVALVRSRILLAAAIGLLVALLTGVLVARALTVRVLRLERTAQRVAQGDFEAHFSDSSGDELGQLAAALAHMQSQLEGLETARRRFIATASHELRTPIFSLGGFLELIQDEALDEDTRRQFVGQLRAQVERLGKLATQLLDLSRLESGPVELAETTTDLGVLARAVSAEFVPALAQHDSQLALRIPEDPIRVVCDPERVAQLLRILIDNSLVHTPSGTRVTVAAAAAEKDDGARLSVRDSGPGIPDEAIDRVFEPFYSADDARGAGLGLAIARELAMHMNARLEIASEPGDTAFTLILATSED
jgi:two-component system OmpR family sensor kinase